MNTYRPIAKQISWRKMRRVIHDGAIPVTLFITYPPDSLGLPIIRKANEAYLYNGYYYASVSRVKMWGWYTVYFRFEMNKCVFAHRGVI